MNKTYYYDKKIFDRDDVDRMLIFFDNGDYVNLPRKEIKSLNITLSDRLIWINNCLCPVGVGGEIKLLIKDKPTDYIYSDVFVCDKKEYNKSRKSYIVTRCLTDRITHVRFFNDNNWHDTVYGHVTATMEDGLLTLSFINVFNEPKDDTKCYIRLNDTTANNVDHITLDFENCEGFDIYKDEIKEMQINYAEKLVWGSGDMNREILNGYLLLQFQDLDYRDTNLFDDKKHNTIKRLIDRLCNKYYITNHDICHLYIEYDYAGFGDRRRECVEINDIRPPEELPNDDYYDNDDYDDDDDDYESCPCFIGGYCRKIGKNEVLICFGKKAEKLVEKLDFEK